MTFYNQLAGLDIIDDSMFGFKWPLSSADDRVTFINDSADAGTGTSPSGSKRAAFMGKIRPFECTHNMGTVNWLSPDVTKLVDGITPSHLADPNYLQMVRIPAHYIKTYEKGGYSYRLYSERKHPGWEYIPAYAVARYHGTVSGTKLLSYANLQVPSVNFSLQTANTYAHNVNAYAEVWDMWRYTDLAFMMVLDAGRFNAQIYWTGVTASSTAYADSVPCGKTNALTTPNGNGAVYQVNVGGTNYPTTPFRWRYIENFYGGIRRNIIGAYATHVVGEAIMKAYMTKARASFNTASSLAGHSLIGNMPFSQDYIKEFLSGSIFPASIGASSTTYKCDYYGADVADTARTNSFAVGGYSALGSASGPFYLFSSWSPSSSSVAVGASLMMLELPEAIASL